MGLWDDFKRKLLQKAAEQGVQRARNTVSDRLRAREDTAEIEDPRAELIQARAPVTRADRQKARDGEEG